MTIRDLTIWVVTSMLGGMLSGHAAAQNLSDVYRITDGGQLAIRAETVDSRHVGVVVVDR